MPGFGTLAPSNDRQDPEALENLAAQQDADRPSGLSTMWSAIKHPSLYPMFHALTSSAPVPASPDIGPRPQQGGGNNLPDVGAPLIPSGPQISPGTAFGRLATSTGQNLVRGVDEVIKSGATLPSDVYAGRVSMWGPSGHSSDEPIQRSVDLASLAGGGGASALERAAAPGLDLRVMGRKLLSDTGQPGMAISTAAHAPQYTTGIESALARIPSQELTGLQWLNQLKRFGAKPEELQWRELGPALEGLGNTKISRTGIEEHLQANPVQLNRIEKGNKSWEDLTAQQQYNIKDQYDDLSAKDAALWDNPKEYYEYLQRNGSLNSSFQVPEYEEYKLPGGENYRERLIQMPTSGDNFTREHGSHWDEPNVLFHRRSTDRSFDQPLTPEQAAQNFQRERMLQQNDDIQQQQGEVARQINGIRRQHDDRIRQDYSEGRIDAREVRRQFEAAENIPEMKPLQDKLQALRAQEDDLRRNMPNEVWPQTIRSLHDEENQSDWHQQGRDKGYAKDIDTQVAGLSKQRDDLRRQRDQLDQNDPRYMANLDDLNNQIGTLRYQIGRLQSKDVVPNAPFAGTGWERLALHDQLREAAEKGYPRISWTAGEENTTNPLVMLRDQGRDISELAPDQRAEAIQADKGIRDYYNRRRVDQANKIGKAHGVQVVRSELPNEERRQPFEPKAYSVYHMDIPDSLRRELLTKPMSLFEDSGIGAAPAVAQHAQQQTDERKTRYRDWYHALRGDEEDELPPGAKPVPPVLPYRGTRSPDLGFLGTRG